MQKANSKCSFCCCSTSSSLPQTTQETWELHRFTPFLHFSMPERLEGYDSWVLKDFCIQKCSVCSHTLSFWQITPFTEFPNLHHPTPLDGALSSPGRSQSPNTPLLPCHTSTPKLLKQPGGKKIESYKQKHLLKEVVRIRPTRKKKRQSVP